MLVRNIQYHRQGTDTIFSADIEIVSSQLRRRRDAWLGKFRTFLGLPSLSKKLWFRVPTEYANPDAVYDAFFIATFPMAVALNEDLTFEGAVSPLLLQRRSKIQVLLGFPNSQLNVQVEKAARKKEKPQKAYGQFFTLGVDSFHTLLINKPKHLIFVKGFDIPRKAIGFLREVSQRIQDVAAETGTTAVFISSNLREISNCVINWEVFFGGALASVGVLLGAKVGHIWMNGSYFSPDQIHGGTPKLDPLWSTETTEFLPNGYQETRLQKIQEMQRSPHFKLVPKHLRVCWKNMGLFQTVYNCSRCEKCLRTQFALLACRVTSPNFAPMEPEKLPVVSVPKISQSQWEAIYALLKKDRTTTPQVLAYLERVISW